MKAFSKLFTEIDQTTSTNEKTDAIVRYLTTAPPIDAVWCVALLAGRRPKRVIKSGELRQWCAEASGIPVWLLEESYHIVGDLAETISLLLPPGAGEVDYPLHVIMDNLLGLPDDDLLRKQFITDIWEQLTQQELFIFNKLITGEFRMGVSEKLVVKALAKRYELDENLVAHRISGQWKVEPGFFDQLTAETGATDDLSKPYPFYLAYPLEEDPETLGPVTDWIVERKFDGIRGQIIVRDGQLFVWSRGEDLMTEKFSEFAELARILPGGTVLDGEIIPVKEGKFLPFHVMQTRIGRKNVSKKHLAEAPLMMVCYDQIEHNGVDIRHLSIEERRKILEQTVADAAAQTMSSPLAISPLLSPASWEEVAQLRLQARDELCEGLMLKHKHSTYKTGRRRGEWWKWKVDPLSVDGVLLYAQRGHGRRANLYTDFTLAVWDGDELVPFTKAYSGLTDKELLEADNWIKRHTLDKFGPVRSVTPELVFEIGFEGINPSPRHKSGVALRFPRILRWRKDKPASEANTKEDLLRMLGS